MDLQHQQLQQLTNWLDVTEARIKRMGAQPLGPDLEDVKHQVEEHKVGSCRPVARLMHANMFFPKLKRIIGCVANCIHQLVCYYAVYLCSGLNSTLHHTLPFIIYQK